jgi:choline dehydrogenase
MATREGAAAGDTFDYVIVGSGAAGSVLAHRLTEQPGATVCVLEAGPPDRHPYIHVPAGFTKMLFNPDFTWQFKTEPSEGSGGRPIPTTQGRTLGGSSSINGMIYNRGQRADLDSWAQRGNRGWGYVDMLPYYKRTERRIGIGDDRIHGREGNLPVTDIDWIHPICEAFIAGAIGAGIPRCVDYNSGDRQAGVGYFQRAINRGWRHSAARVFLHPAKATGRLEIRTDARAAAVLFEGKRATGVRYVNDRSVWCMRGARSSCRAARPTRRSCCRFPASGRRICWARSAFRWCTSCVALARIFATTISARLVARVKNSTTINELARDMGLAGQIMRWAMGKPSILALSPSLVHWFWKSDDSMDQPDLQGVFSPASYKQGFVGLLDDYPGMTCGVWQHRPESIGYVRARSADPFEDPIIQPNYLAEPMDRRVLIAGMKLARKLLHTPELAHYFDGDRLPGPQVQSDDEFLDYARQYGSTSYHLIGTARMGPTTDPTAVVDDQLRVHGMQGLRVADASIMPSMPSANTYATTMMIAEKASAMILADAGSRRRPPAVACWVSIFQVCIDTS